LRTSPQQIRKEKEMQGIKRSTATEHIVGALVEDTKLRMMEKQTSLAIGREWLSLNSITYRTSKAALMVLGDTTVARGTMTFKASSIITFFSQTCSGVTVLNTNNNRFNDYNIEIYFIDG
jgi:hypothetical protein